ncbi:MAG: hypothetical protein BAJALOKI2v1_20081 [Promethearchaeota archaeon]|nr:MAG: hypothetical protein BAJALOKI2v1_20081 [Candidatus Lokiarchaeota archaeon]
MTFRFLRPDAESVWKNERVKKTFSRYRNILDKEETARYLIAKNLECEFTESDPLQELETLLKGKSEEFNELLGDYSKQEKKINSESDTEKNYINLAETIARRYLESCIFCERRCEVNRIAGEKGYCFLTEDSYLASAFLHMGEESVLIPSGTIFFQSCNFGCVFCQNYDISQSWKKSKEISDVAQKVTKKDIAEIAETLANKGAKNINYVGGDPIPNIHNIIGSLHYQESNICQLWNSNFYISNEALDLIIDFMDFWLPDFKFSTECAQKYSGVQNYFEIITRNLKRIHDEGSGEIIIRHLVMPSHVDCCSKPILDFIAKEIPDAAVNIMGQYRSQYKAHRYEEINRSPTSEEISEVKKYAQELGVLWKPVS